MFLGGGGWRPASQLFASRHQPRQTTRTFPLQTPQLPHGPFHQVACIDFNRPVVVVAAIVAVAAFACRTAPYPRVASNPRSPCLRFFPTYLRAISLPSSLFAFSHDVVQERYAPARPRYVFVRSMELSFPPVGSQSELPDCLLPHHGLELHVSSSASHICYGNWALMRPRLTDSGIAHPRDPPPQRRATGASERMQRTRVEATVQQWDR